MEQTGAKSGEEDSKEQYDGSLHVFKEKVGAKMSDPKFFQSVDGITRGSTSRLWMGGLD